MSNGNYGMQTAAQKYYGKDLQRPINSTTALLAGMPQAPNQYDPYSHPEEAKNVEIWFYQRCKRQGYFTAEQYETAIIHLSQMVFKV